MCGHPIRRVPASSIVVVIVAPGETAQQRWNEIEELVDRLLAITVDRFARMLS